MDPKDLKEIKAIIDLMKKHDLSVFEIEKEGFRLKLEKGPSTKAAAAAPPAAAGTPKAAVAAPETMPAAPKANPDDLSLADLQAEAETLRTKINRFRESLGRFFVNKQEIIDLMVVAAIAQEPPRLATSLTETSAPSRSRKRAIRVPCMSVGGLVKTRPSAWPAA